MALLSTFESTISVSRVEIGLVQPDLNSKQLLSEWAGIRIYFYDLNIGVRDFRSKVLEAFKKLGFPTALYST